MYIEDYVTAKKPIGYWRELLREWTFLVHRIYRVSGKSTSVHAEKERANTGLLAAAATRNGWVALEECRTDKTGKQSKKDSYTGRCDLVLWRDRRHHEIEAKCVRIVLPSSSISRIKKPHDRAIADSNRSTESGYVSEKKIAITYIVPTMNPDRLKSLTNDDVGIILRDLIKKTKTALDPKLMLFSS